MIGLSKVVELNIYDYSLPKSAKVNKKKSNDISFKYRWKNSYFLGNKKICESSRYDNIKKKPIIFKKYDDEYLYNLCSKIVEGDNSLDSQINEYDDCIMYVNDNNRSSIMYFGNNYNKIKNKILTKKR